MWVLGHRIRPFDTDATYGMIEITSPPHVPGPPPHVHKHENEFFFIVRGHPRRHGRGDMAPVRGRQLPRPAAERFFTDFGIPAAEPHAQDRSAADQVVEKVVRNVEAYGMYIAA